MCFIQPDMDHVGAELLGSTPRSRTDASDRLQKLRVGLELVQRLDQPLHRLHRLERKGWIAAEWKASELGPRLRVYHLTKAGKRQLMSERSRWQRLTAAIAGILDPAQKEDAP